MITLLTVVSLLVISLLGAKGSPYVISDDRIRGLDITPVLGRGYSVATNSFQSTCLQVESTTSPSYNYDYYFTDLTDEKKTESMLSGTISGSFGYAGVKASVAAAGASIAKSKQNTHIIVATMRIERFYSSIQEDKAHLSPDAATLLEKKDYIGFFKACGPNYVRSIRRAQEVTAIFSFESTDLTSASSFAASVQASGWGQSAGMSMAGSRSNTSIKKSLTIKISGYGLGLNHEGASTLVSTSLEEFNEVMKFAFKSMTKDSERSDGSGEHGMVYGMEVVPWVDNTSFQVNSKLHSEQIYLPMPRHMIPKAEVTSDNQKVCRDPVNQVDKTGRCCELATAMERFETPQARATREVSIEQGLETEDPLEKEESRICRPQRSLDPSIMKNNMALNGEFVALLDSTVRYKLNNLFLLEKCISAVRAIPDRFDFHYLKSSDTVLYDKVIEQNVTVIELRQALDPARDYGLLKLVGRELDDFISHFYSPCLAALLGTNIGVTDETDPKFFMAEAWYNHAECMKISCVADNMRWDHEEQECSPSFLVEMHDNPSVSNNVADGKCVAVFDEETAEEMCRDETEDNEYRASSKACWTKIHNERSGGSTFSVMPVHLMDHFCLPELSGNKATDYVIEKIEENLCNDYESPSI